jgi:phosphoribosylformylglycinamidine cyclo-ligase
LPEGTKAVLEERRWPRPPIFDLIQRLGGVPREDMLSTFNMGLGMVAVLPHQAVKAALALLAGRGVPAWEVGRVEASSGEPTATVLP